MTKSKNNIDKLVDHLFRKEYGRLVSYLTYLLGQTMIQYAEDIAQDTIEYAYKIWRDKEVPDNPSAWLFTVARNKAYNLINKEKKQTGLLHSYPEGSNEIQNEVWLDHEIEDSMLRMFFACCSPKLSFENQVILILNTLCGFNRVEISRALLLEEETLKKRLFRLKKDIRDKKISFTIPAGNDLKSRLNTIKNTLYLFFNNGYNSYQGKEIIQKDICLEAIRLCKLIIKHFPKDAEIKALMSLMCFHVARFDARTNGNGSIVTLDEQERKLWNRELIDIAHYYLSEASEEEVELSSYHIEANIAAIYCHTENLSKADWERIYRLYSWLYLYKPSPIITINLAIIESKITSSSNSIDLLNLLEKEEKSIRNHHLFYATRGHFYQQEAHHPLAISDFKKARQLAKTDVEKLFLEEKIKRSKLAMGTPLSV